MLILIASLVGLWLIGKQKGEVLPPADQIEQAVYRAPVQEATTVEAFNVQVGDMPFRVQPRFTYEITGLVVSGHHSDSLFDYYHKASEDYFNVCDLAMVWGINAKTGIYERGNFHNQDFCAIVNFDEEMDWIRFRTIEFSNNHLITENDELRARLKSVRPGDQVQIRGYLAEYFWPPARHRGTSIVREDMGNHACETIYVTKAQILKAGNSGWRMAQTAGKYLALSLIGIQLVAGANRLRQSKRPKFATAE